MIVKPHLAPRRIVTYIKVELALGVAAGVAAYLLVDTAGLGWLVLPASLATVLGTALSILLAVRANAAYQRWWEASAMWAQIAGASRNLGRVVVTLGDAKATSGAADPAAVREWQLAMLRRQAAWANALRLQLRRQDDWGPVLERLPEEERPAVAAADAKPALLLALQSRAIFAAYAKGILSGLDNFQLEQALAALSTQQALAERTKLVPYPRQYDVFTRRFVHLFIVVFPLTALGVIAAHRWVAIPATLLVALVFGVVERAAASTEAPFENTVQDVPLTALCTAIERDLLEALGDPAVPRPPAAAPVAGYLW